MMIGDVLEKTVCTAIERPADLLDCAAEKDAETNANEATNTMTPCHPFRVFIVVNIDKTL